MSIHAQISDEARASLQKQKATSTVSSIIIALLGLVLIGIILTIITLASNVKKQEPFISYIGDNEVTEEIPQEVVQSAVQSKPAAQSSSASKIITSTLASDLAIPTPDQAPDVPSPDLGESEGFGTGFGSGNGSGYGGNGGGVGFFGSTTNAKTIAYVIDYSESMSPVQIALVRKEVELSINELI